MNMKISVFNHFSINPNSSNLLLPDDVRSRDNTIDKFQRIKAQQDTLLIGIAATSVVIVKTDGHFLQKLY